MATAVACTFRQLNAAGNIPYMMTGTMTNQTWDVGKAAGQCSACQVALAAGAACWAALIEVPPSAEKPSVKAAQPQPADFQRLDFCPNCWQAGKRPEPPGQLFSYWKTSIPETQPKKKLFVDDSVLIDLFNRLAEKPDLQDMQFRFVLALLLMRKRILRYDGCAPLGAEQLALLPDAHPQPEMWRMTLRGAAVPLEVINPHLSVEQISNVSQQLSQILAEDI